MSKSDRADNNNKETGMTGMTTKIEQQWQQPIATAAATATATTQKSMMTINLANRCNQKPKTTTARRHSQWQHRRQLQ
jgi:hypothetical protein